MRVFFKKAVLNIILDYCMLNFISVLPTLIPFNFLLFLMLIAKASMTRINQYADRVYPC